MALVAVTMTVSGELGSIVVVVVGAAVVDGVVGRGAGRVVVVTAPFSFARWTELNSAARPGMPPAPRSSVAGAAGEAFCGWVVVVVSESVLSGATVVVDPWRGMRFTGIRNVVVEASSFTWAAMSVVRVHAPRIVVIPRQSASATARRRGALGEAARCIPNSVTGPGAERKCVAVGRSTRRSTDEADVVIEHTKCLVAPGRGKADHALSDADGFEVVDLLRGGDRAERDDLETVGVATR